MGEQYQVLRAADLSAPPFVPLQGAPQIEKSSPDQMPAREGRTSWARPCEPISLLEFVQSFEERFEAESHRVGDGFALDVPKVWIGRGARARDDASGYADHDGVGRHRVQHDGVGADAAVVADGDGSEDLGPGADDHPVADGRVALLVGQARAPEGHSLVDRHVVADHGGLADHDSRWRGR